MSPTRDFQETLMDALRNPEQAAEYLTAVLEDGDPQALALALKDVARAQTVPMTEEEGAALYRLKSSLEAAGLHLKVSVETVRQS